MYYLFILYLGNPTDQWFGQAFLNFRQASNSDSIEFFFSRCTSKFKLHSLKKKDKIVQHCQYKAGSNATPGYKVLKYILHWMYMYIYFRSPCMLLHLSATCSLWGFMAEWNRSPVS
eukprot:scpid20247/ scgid17531/ 